MVSDRFIPASDREWMEDLFRQYLTKRDASEEIKEPRFSRGDKVAFTENGIQMEGTIVQVDYHGGGACYGIEPSYDILVSEDGADDIVWKHIGDSQVRKS